MQAFRDSIAEDEVPEPTSYTAPESPQVPGAFRETPLDGPSHRAAAPIGRAQRAAYRNPSSPSRIPRLISFTSHPSSSVSVPHIPIRAVSPTTVAQSEEEVEELVQDNLPEPSVHTRPATPPIIPNPVAPLVVVSQPPVTQPINHLAQPSVRAMAAIPMPKRTDKNRPTFDDKEPRALPRYFEDLEDWLASAQIVADEEKKRYAVRYVSIETEDVWRALPNFPANHSYDDWKAEVIALYPGADTSRRYTRPEYEDLVRRWRARGITTIGDWSEFYREASAMSSWLIARNKLSQGERDREAMNVFAPALRERVLARLQIKLPDTHPEDGYQFADIKTAVEHILYGTSSKPSAGAQSVATTAANPSIQSATAPAVKFEDSQLLDLLRAAVAGGAQAAPSTSYSAPRPPQNNSGCHYCGDVGHRITDCPRVAEDTQAGLVKRSAEGKVVLPAGAQVSRQVPGNNMRERIMRWHQDNPGQIAKGTMSYSVASSPSSAPPTSTSTVSSMLYEISRPANTPSATFAYMEEVPDEEHERQVRDLERQLFALRARGPIRRSPRNHDGSNRTADLSRAPPIAPAPPAPTLPRDTTPEVTSVPTAPVPTDTPAGAPEHPFAAARDATYAPPVERNVGALPSKPKEAREPAYRNVAPIENPATADKVLTQLLKTPSIQLTVEEVFAVSPIIRDKLRAQLTPKRVATETAQFLHNIAPTNPVLPSPEELLQLCNQGKAPRGVLRIPDPYEAYLARLGPGDTPIPLTVARESHSLRSIHSLVGEQGDVECVIDPGSQIVSMSEATCHALGLHYDPSIILNMQSANGTVDSSLGLARNVPFRIGDIVIYLQVHVIREAAYDILLGRPFDVLTASVIRNYHNEDQTITLHCPNSGATATVPTFARGSARFRMPHPAGF